jgi:hypothetical protein
VDGPALGVTGARDQLRLLEDLDVFRDRLLGDRERFRQIIHGSRAPAEPGDDAATDRIGEGQEGQVELIVVAFVHWVPTSRPGFNSESVRQLLINGVMNLCSIA